MGQVIDMVAVEENRRPVYVAEPAPPHASPGAPPTHPVPGQEHRIAVEADGQITGGRHRVLSEITGETFGTDEPALRDLQRAFREKREAQRINRPASGITATPEGNLVFADRDTDSNRALAQITNETFGSVLSDLIGAVFGASEGGAVQTAPPPARAAQHRQLLPANARWLTVDGVGGWMYQIVNDYGDCYTVFLFQRPSNRRWYAKLIDPDPSQIRHGHIFGDGIICLTTARAHGCDSVEHAHGRLVAWAFSTSHWLRTGHFPLK